MQPNKTVTAQDLFQEILKWDSEKGDDKKLIVKIENMLSQARQEAVEEYKQSLHHGS